MAEIKIAMLGSMPPLRAISSYCLELAQALARKAPIVFLSFKKIYPAFLYPGGKLEADSSFPPISQPRLEVQRRLTWYNPLTWMKAGFLTHADLVHAQWWSLPLFPIYWVILAGFRLRKKPVLITIHNVLPHEKSRAYVLFSSVLYRLGHHFIVHSEQNRAQLIQHYRIAPERISVIAHGPLELFQCNLTPQQARAALKLSQDAQVLLLFGAIRPYKGVDTALEAFAQLTPKHPHLRLLIAGKCWQDWNVYQQLIERYQLESRVQLFLDYIPTDRVGLYFQAADLVLLPYHRFDSQSGIGGAALAFEKPLIVSDTGGLPELVQSNPAQVIPPGDARALAQAIDAALSNPEQLEEMRTRAHQVRQAMAWPAIAEHTFAIYRRLLEARK